MPKSTSHKDAFRKMLQEKLGGTNEMQGRKDGLTSITEKLRQTIPKHRELPGLR